MNFKGLWNAAAILTKITGTKWYNELGIGFMEDIDFLVSEELWELTR